MTVRNAGAMLAPIAALTMLSLVAGVSGRWWAWGLAGVAVEVARRIRHRS